MINKEVVMGKLVLSRKKGESILVGDDIVVKIIGIEGSQVKVLIEAPDEVVILREELKPTTAS